MGSLRFIGTKVRRLFKSGVFFVTVIAGVIMVPLVFSNRTFHVGEYSLNASDLELRGGVAHADVPVTGGDGGGGEGGEGGDGGGGEGGEGGEGDCP